MFTGILLLLAVCLLAVQCLAEEAASQLVQDEETAPDVTRTDTDGGELDSPSSSEESGSSESDSAGTSVPICASPLSRFQAHSTDCTHYYLCDSSGPILMPCPAGLNWNPTLNVCDWPDLAGCEANAED